MIYILAISIFLSTPFDHTDDICLYMSSYQGNVIYRTIDTRNLKMMQVFNRHGYYIATTENLYIGNRNDVIDQFRRAACPDDYVVMK